jgi:hypothetical protein
MANANVIASLTGGFLQGSIAPLAIGTSTVATAFSMNVNPITGGGGGPAVLMGPAENNTPSYYAGCRPFKVTAYGTALTKATETVLIGLYQVPGVIAAAGTAGVLANDNLVKASTARSIANGTAPWYIDFVFQYEPVSQRLFGSGGFAINGLVDASAAGTIVTGLVGDGDLNFIVAATMGTGTAGDLITLTEISISQV